MAQTNQTTLAPSPQQKPRPTPIQTNTMKDDYPDILNADSPRTSINFVSAKDEYSPGDGNEYNPMTGHGKYTVNLFDEIIPHPDEVHHRNLVLCFDGTGDQFDADNSNIVEFFSMLKKDNRHQQMVYYQAGIGTYNIPEIAKPWMSKLARTLDMMIGIHLNAHIMGGYEFLMENYQTGDRIFIFGFSRGAYTARALAGMIHKIGLLPPSNHQQVPFAYKMYTREDDLGWQQSNQFKKAFSVDVDIEFVGVWDTVASVGIIPKRLPFTKANNHIRYFRHAISLDERRVRFKANLWNRPSAEEHGKGIEKGTMPKHYHGPKPSIGSAKAHGNGDHTAKSAKSRKKRYEYERQYSDPNKPTDCEEVWFAGVHCDVGGGSVANGTRYSLARIPLRWMIRQCFILNTGILFHKHQFKNIGLDPDTLYPEVLPRPPLPNTKPDYPSLARRFDPPLNFAKSYNDTIVKPVRGGREPFVNEEEEDMLDALAPMFDQLKLAKWWWVLECIPIRLRHQNDDGKWKTQTRVNLGSARSIPDQTKNKVKVHRTVKIRMDAGASGEFFKDKGYETAAKFKDDSLWIS